MKKQDRNSGYFDNFDKLESLKHEYKEIPVPDAAKARILAGIKEGKRKHSPFLRILRTTGTTAGCA